MKIKGRKVKLAGAFFPAMLLGTPAVASTVTYGNSTGNVPGVISGSSEGGQSFTATENGLLKTISLKTIFNHASFTLKVYSGEGVDGTLLHTQSFTTSNSYAYSTYTLDSDVTLTSNSIYTFTAVGASLIASRSDSYSGGQFYSSTDGGVSWVDYSDADLVFEIEQSVITNSAPTAITLLNNFINENSASGTVIGILSTTDSDVGDSHTYSIQSQTVANAFQIANSNELQVQTPIDYETTTSVNLTIRTTDSGGLTFDQLFTIFVNDLNDAPTNVVLSNSSIDENSASGTVIGTLSTTDSDSGDSHTYTITSQTPAGVFQIANTNELQVLGSLDYETLTSASVTVQTRDQGGTGLTFSKSLTIDINDVDDTAPTLTAVSIASNNSDSTKAVVGDIVTLTFTASEPLNGNPTVTINGNSVSIGISSAPTPPSISGVSATGGTYTAQYTVQAGDSGTLTFTIDFTDTAGNIGTQVTATTDSSSVVIVPNSILIASSTLDETNEIAIPTTAKTVGAKVSVLDFTIVDGGDSKTTDISQIVLKTSGTADLSKVSWILNGSGASDIVGVYDSSLNTITFTTTISIADTSSETYTISGYFSDATGVTDNATVGLSVNGSSDITVDTSKTVMATGQSDVNNSENAKFSVTATRIRFSTLPSNQSR
jgi:hypothetical protein